MQLRSKRSVTGGRLHTVSRNSCVISRASKGADMLELCALLKAGAHSEFEIWGLQHFFTPDLLRRSVAQYTVNLGSRTVYLDRGFPEEMVGIELDGTRWHDRPDRRELDRRRDAALARAGWLVIRISYRRATSETQQARRDVIEVLATRREQLGLPPAASKRRVMRPSAARHAAVRLLSDA